MAKGEERVGLVAAFSNLLPSVLLVLSVTVKSLAHRVQSLVVLSLLLTPYTLPLGGFTKKSAAHRLSAVSTNDKMADVCRHKPTDENVTIEELKAQVALEEVNSRLAAKRLALMRAEADVSNLSIGSAKPSQEDI